MSTITERIEAMASRAEAQGDDDLAEEIRRHSDLADISNAIGDEYVAVATIGDEDDERIVWAAAVDWALDAASRWATVKGATSVAVYLADEDGQAIDAHHADYSGVSGSRATLRA